MSQLVARTTTLSVPPWPCQRANLTDDPFTESSQPRMQPDSVRRMERSGAPRQPGPDPFRALAELEDGWDSYSAPAPSRTAIENAKDFVEQAHGLNGRVEPSAMGGVGVTFSSGVREVSVEFYNQGTAHALFADDRTEEMRTQPVPTNTEGYRAIVGQVRNFLHDD